MQPRSSGDFAWRERLLPRSALGLSLLILSASLGAAFSGAVLYAYYDYRLNRNEDRVTNFASSFDKRFKAATDTIKAEREDAKSEIRKELEPLQRTTAEGGTVEAVLRKAVPSV